MLMFPKIGKRPKKAPKPLKRSRIRPGRVKFWDNGKRERRLTDAQVWARATECRLERVRNATAQEIECGAILRRHRINAEFQKIWLNGDRWIISDWNLPDHKTTLEIDGFQHGESYEYDHRKSLWLARTYLVGTLRFWNGEFDSGNAEARIVQTFGLS